MAEPTFKPCPFCGTSPRYLAFKDGFYTERVICDECSFHLKPEQWQQRATPGVTAPHNTEQEQTAMSHFTNDPDPLGHTAGELSELEEVIACLGDDAAQLREENPEDERAANMDRAADLLRQGDEKDALLRRVFLDLLAQVRKFCEDQGEAEFWTGPAEAMRYGIQGRPAPEHLQRALAKFLLREAGGSNAGVEAPAPAGGAWEPDAWAAYIAGVLVSYLSSENAARESDRREAAITGIVRRRIHWLMPAAGVKEGS